MRGLTITLVNFDESGMIAGMGFPARVRQATLLSATLLLGASTHARTQFIGSLEPQQAREFDRVHELMVPLAQGVLQSADRDELEANIESQLFSGLFADILARSMAALQHPPGEMDELPDEFRARFLESVERLGADRSKVDRALELTLLSNRLVRATVSAGRNAESGDSAWSDSGDDGDLSQIDLADFLYDIEVPVELREAAYASGQSGICLIAIAYAAERNVDTPKWLVEDLVHRWISGQRESLPATWALANELGVVIAEDLAVKLDRISETEGVAPLGMIAARERADLIAGQLEVIAEHAERQPDGVWPRKA